MILPRPRLRRSLLPAVLLLLAVTGRAEAAPPNALAGIRTAYDQIYAACQRRDLDRALSFLTPDYAVTNQKGERTDRAQTCLECRERMEKIKTFQGRYTVGSLTAAPGGFWVEMRMHTEGVWEKQILFAHFRAPFTSDLTARDLWVQTPQGWRLKCRQILQGETRLY